MESKAIIKVSKYSKRYDIDLNSLSLGEIDQLLNDISDESIGLCKCLRSMLTSGLVMQSFGTGKGSIAGVGYISMAEGEDIFSYLSEEFINSGIVQLIVVGGIERIDFVGSDGEKERMMLLLSRDIQTGRKSNRQLIEKKLNQPFSMNWVRRLEQHEGIQKDGTWGERVQIMSKVIK